MGTHFTGELAQTIEAQLGRYETRRSAILPILHAIQDAKGWIREEDIEALEKEYSLSAVDVREVLLFYTMYRSGPCKPYRFEVCNSVSCWLCGADKTLDVLKARAKEWKTRTGDEAPFEVHEVSCLGLCGEAPVMYVNKDRHLKVTPDVALRLVDEYVARRGQGGL